MNPETPRDFGEELRRERELREVTRAQLAAATKVSLRQIEALEIGRFEALPALVFTRGFVQSIATHLGLDPQRTVAGFSHVYRTWAAAQPESDRAPASGTHPVLTRRTVRSSSTLVGVGVAALLALVTGAAVFMRSRGAPDRSAGSAAVPTAVVERPDTGPASLALPPAIAAATVPLPTSAPLVAPAAASSASPAFAPAADPIRPATAEASQVAGALALTLSFRDDCWTEVSVDGRMQVAELVRKGSTRRFSGGRFTLTLGNPAGVEVILDGRAIPTDGKAGEVLRNFVIDDATTRRFPVRG